jgi:hypothetical protein
MEGLSDILKQCAVFCFAFSFFTPHRNARFEIMYSSAGLLIDDPLALLKGGHESVQST